MFHHVVLLRFTPSSSPEAHRTIVEALRQLPATIPELLHYEVNLDAGLLAANAHVGVAATFADEAGWRTYSDHPDHRRVITDLIEPILETSLRHQYAD